MVVRSREAPQKGCWHSICISRPQSIRRRHSPRAATRLTGRNSMEYTAPRKKSRTALWVVVTLGVLVGYLLSMGPAAWFVWQDWSPEWSFQTYRRVYAPVLFLARVGPRPIYDAADWYVSLWQQFGIARFVWNA